MAKLVHLIIFLCCSLTIFFAIPSIAQSVATENVILGKWIDKEQSTVLEFYKEGNTVSGRIVWLNNDKPATDLHNDNPQLQNRPLRGINMVASALYNGSSQIWEKGTIYDYQNGTTYNCQMWLANPNPPELHIKMYGYLPIFGTTSVWYRPSKNHPIYKGSR